ncbi:TetR/AcrR family transcriptional regulator [Cytobacillus sp. FJAT-54145]|uniref:TetR/AcrR family transcriptional regulator n=1 Tax=Cytobacillus spartinae TaxID=3299023 RepID=A0ABW6KDK6_9BACI
MVQVQKPEIKNAILREAKREFIENGFQQTSIRRIAKNANITSGNIYKYFSGKEVLFEHLVSTAKEGLYDYIKEKATRTKIHAADAPFDILEFAHLMSDYRDEILLLTDASAGTKYENTTEEIIKMITINIRLFLPNFGFPDNKSGDILARSVAVGLLSGLLEILRTSTDKGEINTSVTDYITFVFRSYM